MKYLLYITSNKDNIISSFSLEPNNGRLDELGGFHINGAPGPLAVHRQYRVLYVGLRGSNELAALRIDPATGALSPLCSVELRSDPCFLSLDNTGRYLLSAYYRAGAIACHAIRVDGTIVQKPYSWIRTKSYAHAVRTDPSNRFAFVPHVGKSNRILQFRFDAETGRLARNKPFKLIPKSKDGPRHLSFHPNGRWVYVSNEQSSSVTQYHLDHRSGVLIAGQTVSSRPCDLRGENSCAQIHLHPTGAFLYVSNRGDDSIACFSINQANGEIEMTGQHPTERVPRAFAIDPEGRYLFAAGEASGRMASYRIDQSTGLLDHLRTYSVGGTPLWVLPIRLG